MPMQDRVGQQFGNYRLTRLIGSGGYSEVYLAEHIHLSSLQYAIKVLTGTDLKGTQQDLFRAEARIVADLQRLSSHIVKIIDFGVEDSGTPYIVMEYAAAGTLRRLYPKGSQLPPERILFYVQQIAEALQCAHNQSPPVVHCDVKPENMLLRTNDHLLLSDFGIAFTGQTESLVLPTRAPIIGTATYIAPERLRSQTRRASDQYSLAIVVYEWFSGKPPFEGTSAEICYQQIKEPPPPLYPRCVSVTQAIEQVIMRALAKSPEERYPTIQHFADALHVATQDGLITPTLITPPFETTIMPTLAMTRTPADRRIPAMASSLDTPPSPLPVPSLPTLSFPRGSRTFDVLGIPRAGSRAPQVSTTVLRSTGLLLNAVSAGLVGFFAQSILALVGSFLGLALLFIVHLLVEKLTFFYIMIIALYWGFVGWLTGNYFASLQSYHTFYLPTVIGILFLVISFGVQYWFFSGQDL